MRIEMVFQDELRIKGKPADSSSGGAESLPHPGLYLHIPFCLSKCRYCNFYSVTEKSKLPDFLSALFKEIFLCRNVFESFDTLYIGGGSPSVLSGDQLGDLLDHLRKNIVLHDEAEITMEVNPADVNGTFLAKLRWAGINRVSIGVQSFDDEILKFLGRRHNGSQALKSISAVRQAGFDNFGIDLIYGIPGQSRESWKRTLMQTASLEIPHLSCYQLTVEAGTPLGRAHKQGLIEMPDDDTLFEEFIETSEFLEESGYCHYEVSNFCREESLVSRHNSKYWRHVPYLGLGPAAHSFDGEERWWNVRSVDDYLRLLNSDNLPVENHEILTEEERLLESFFLGFRTKAGISLADFERKHGFDLWTSRKSSFDALIAAGHLKIEDGCLRPTRTGMALADSLALL